MFTREVKRQGEKEGKGKQIWYSMKDSLRKMLCTYLRCYKQRNRADFLLMEFHIKKYLVENELPNMKIQNNIENETFLCGMVK